MGSALGVAILGTILFATLVGPSRDNLAATLPDVPAQCRELVVTLVDESAGQILPTLTNPSAASAAGFGGAGTLPLDQVACFGDPAFLAALPRMVPPIEDAFVSAAHFAGYSALAFVVLGVVFSLLLPDTRPGSERLFAEEALPAEVAAAG